MPTKYDEIRKAVGVGFSLDNLRNITNLSLAILGEKPTHPSIFLAIAAVSRWIADAWDDVPITTQVAQRVEGKLKPSLEVLLNVVNGNSADVCAAIDSMATAFQEAVTQGLDQ